MTTYTLPRTYSPAQAKRPVTTHCNASLPLYEARRLDGAWAAVTVSGGKVQMRGPRWAALAWIEENNASKEY